MAAAFGAGALARARWIALQPVTRFASAWDQKYIAVMWLVGAVAFFGLGVFQGVLLWVS